MSPIKQDSGLKRYESLIPIILSTFFVMSFAGTPASLPSSITRPDIVYEADGTVPSIWVRHGADGKIERLATGEQPHASAYGIDVANAFQGHELCTRNPYANCIIALDQQQSFHPNLAGQSALAKKLSSYLP